MADVSVIGLEIDASGAISTLSSVTNKLEATGKAADVLTAKTTTTGASFDKTTAQLVAFNDALDREAESQRRWIAEANAAAATQKGMDAQWRQTSIDLSTVDARYDALIKSMSSATTATKQVTDATREAGLAQDALGTGTEQAALKLGRLQTGVSALIGHMGGMTAETRLLNGALSALGIGGNAIALVVLASTAALGAGYEYLTKQTREAKKAQDEATDSLKKFFKTQQEGAAGKLGADVAGATARLRAEQKELADLTAGGALGIGAGPAQASRAIELQKAITDDLELVRKGKIEVNKLDIAAANEARASYAQRLADLVKNNVATEAERKRAQQLLRDDVAELSYLNKAAASGSFTGVDNTAKRNGLAEEAERLNAALNPTPEKFRAVKEAVEHATPEFLAFQKAMHALDTLIEHTSAAFDAAHERAAKRSEETQDIAAQVQALQDSRDAYDTLTIAQKANAAVAEEEAKLRKDGLVLFPEEAASIREEVTHQQRLLAVKKALIDLKGANPFDIPEGKGGKPPVDQAKEYARELQHCLSIAEQIGNALASGGSSFGANLAVGARGLSQIAAGDVAGGLGTLVSGLDLFGNRARAVSQQLREEAQRLSDTYDTQFRAFHGAVTQASPQQGAIDDVHAQADQLRAELKDLFTAKEGPLAGRILATTEYNRRLGLLNATETQRIAILQAEYAESQKRLQQDLGVRALVALGLDKQADDTAFALAQQREYSDAVKSGADATTLLTLTITQQAEANKRLADQQKALANFSSSLDVRSLRANGDNAGADALQRSLDHQAEIEAAEKKFGLADDSPYIQYLRSVQKAEDDMAAQAEAKRLARSVFDTTNATAAFGDVRGANESAFLEGLRRRVEDAETPLEKLAAAAYATAAAFDFYTKRLEADNRTGEGLANRLLTALGGGREAEDFARTASQRQERVDFANNGASQFNKDFLAFTQRAENSAVQRDRAIEDGTKVLQDSAAHAIAANDFIAAAIKSDAANRVAAIDEQIKSDGAHFDALISQAQQGVGFAQRSLQVAQDSLKALQSIRQFQDTSKVGSLSTLSPLDKLAESQRQFDALVAKAQGGDATAGAGVAGAAQTLLTQSQAFNGSGSGYVSTFNTVQATLDALGRQFGATGNVNVAQAALDAAQAQVQSLQDLKQQNLDALNARKSSISADAQAQLDRLTAINKSISDGLPNAIAKLVDEQNKANFDRIANDPFYSFAQDFISKGGFDLGSVLPDGPLPVVVTPSATPDPVAVASAQSLVDLNTKLADQAKQIDALITAVGTLAKTEATGTDTLDGTLRTIASNTSTLVNTARLQPSAAFASKAR